VREKRYAKACDLHEQAFEIARQIGDRELECGTLMSSGIASAGRDPQRGLGQLKRALEIARETGFAPLECEILNGIGETLSAIGSHHESLDNHRQGLACAMKVGAAHGVARAHEGIAGAASSLGDSETARTHWQEALRLYSDIGVGTDRVRARLAEVGDAERSGAS
jgi:tetratricopeptide (TPR) repeat protein